MKKCQILNIRTIAKNCEDSDGVGFMLDNEFGDFATITLREDSQTEIIDISLHPLSYMRLIDKLKESLETLCTLKSNQKKSKLR